VSYASELLILDFVPDCAIMVSSAIWPCSSD
jgi:hypothetical protein